MEKQIHDLFNSAVLAEASRLFGVSTNDVKKIGGFENFIFGYKKAEEDFILRISHSNHRSYNQIESELDFVNFLAKNKGNVSIPVRSINETFVEVINCDNGTYFTVTSYVKATGVPPRKDMLTDRLFMNYGKTVGQFHQLTKEYHVNDSIEKRISWDEDPIITKAEMYLPKSEKAILNKLHDLVQYLKTLPKGKDIYGLIHTDIHMGNFFVENDELCVFDFDDCSYQWFVSDIAIALFYYVSMVTDEAKRIEMADHFMKLFMRGYQDKNKLDLQAYYQISHFLKLREIILYIAIHRSCDIKTDEWAKKYIAIYKERILNDVAFIDLDFSGYISL